MSDKETLLPKGKGVWIPIDHGVSDFSVNVGNLDQLIERFRTLMQSLPRRSRFALLFQHANFVAHLSYLQGMRERSSDKMLVGSVEEALSRGAKGVSVQVNMGSPDEPEMIERLGAITQDSHFLNCPVLGMIYPRGENLDIMEGDDTNAAAHAARLAFELGCDVVKPSGLVLLNHSAKLPHRTNSSFDRRTAGATTEETLITVHKAMQAGGGFAWVDGYSHIQSKRWSRTESNYSRRF